jgi:AraC family transcriptional regulator
MIKHTMYAVTLGLVLFFLYLFQYTGAFKSVVISQDKRGPYTIVFKDHIGAYHKIVNHIEAVEKWSKENGLKCRLSFGEFFDDPMIVEEGRLKSRAGCIIDPLVEQEQTLFLEIKSKLPPDFSYAVIPQSQAVVALFSGAPGIGPLKVYPAVEDYMVENKLSKSGPIMEIYEVFSKNSMQTTYIWPIQDKSTSASTSKSN